MAGWEEANCGLEFSRAVHEISVRFEGFQTFADVPCNRCPEVAQNVGADGYGAHAGQSVDLGKQAHLSS